MTHQFLIIGLIYVFFGVIFLREFNRIKKVPNFLAAIFGILLWFPILVWWVYKGLRAEWRQP
jgi:hypothetical protein